MYFALSLLIVTIVVCCSFIVIHNIVMVMVHCGPLASLSDEWLTNPKMITIGPAGIISLASFDCQSIFLKPLFLVFCVQIHPKCSRPLCFQNIWLSVRHTTNTTSFLHHLWSVLIVPIFFEASSSSNSVYICPPKLLKIPWFWKHCPLFILKSPPQVTVCTSAWSLAPGSCSGQVVFQCIAWLSTPAIVSTVLDWQIWARLYCST